MATMSCTANYISGDAWSELSMRFAVLYERLSNSRTFNSSFNGKYSRADRAQ
jgi:hypothetical protein